MALGWQPEDVLSSRADWLRFTGLEIRLRPDLRTVVRATYSVVPSQVSAILSEEDVDASTLDVDVHHVRLPIPVHPSGDVALVVGDEGELRAVGTGRSSDGGIGSTTPVVRLTTAQLFAETPITFTQQMTSEERASQRWRYFFFPRAGACLEVALGDFDLAAGVELEIPDDFSVDEIGVVWTSGLDKVRSNVIALLDSVDAALARGWSDSGTGGRPLARLANDLREGVVQPMLEGLGKELEILDSPLRQDAADVDAAAAALRSLGERLRRGCEQLVAVTTQRPGEEGRALRAAVADLRDALRTARLSHAFTRRLAPGRSTGVAATGGGSTRAALAPGTVPPGTYTAILVPYTYRPSGMLLESVTASLLAVGGALALLTWRLWGAFVWDRRVDWSASAERLAASSSDIVAVLVFLPAVPILFVPNLLTKAPPAERRANAYFLGALATGALLGPLLAIMTIGDPDPRRLLWSFVVGAVVAIGLVVFAWRALRSSTATGRSRRRLLRREVGRWLADVQRRGVAHG